MSKISKAPILKDGNPITLEQAEIWTSNWRVWCLENGFDEGNMIRSFYIPIDDINALIKVGHDVGGIRGYLAMPVENSLETVKLVMVATTPPIEEVSVDIIEQIENTDYSTVYDLTRPCPNYCDVNSPLYGPTLEKKLDD